MTPAQIIAAVLQLVALFPTLEPAFVKAVQDFEALINGGGTVTQADIDALIARVQSQSNTIQEIAEGDAAAEDKPAPEPVAENVAEADGAQPGANAKDGDSA